MIIAGSREYTDYDTLLKYFLTLPRPTEIVSGGCRGADRLGEIIAHNYKIDLKRFPADWQTYGRAAGPTRNIKMAEYANCLLACWDGISRGTAHMIDAAQQRNLPVYILTF